MSSVSRTVRIQQSAVKEAVQLVRHHPLHILLLVLVLATAFALPVLLLHVTHKLDQSIGEARDSLSMTLYLEGGVSDRNLTATREALLDAKEITGVEHISPAEARAEFMETTALGVLLETLPENPMPHVLIADIAQDSEPVELSRLKETFEGMSYVDAVDLDVDWVNRLVQMRRVMLSAGWFLLLVLVTTSVLMVRLSVSLMVREQMRLLELYQLFGATKRYAALPYIWMAAFTGGLSACLSVTASSLLILWLDNQLEAMHLLTGNSGINPLSASMVVIVTLGAMSICLLFSWRSLSRYWDSL